jgi:AcrR family transcriptional regulator
MNPYRYITNIKEKHYTDAQQALQKSIIELNQKSEIYNISVKDLCKHAHVARSTFYSYYDNISDLQEDIENDLIYNLLKLNNDFIDIDIVSEEDLDFFKNTGCYITRNREIFYTFLICKPNIRFINKWKDAIKYHFWERLFRNKKKINEKLILELISTQAIAAFIFWLENPHEVNINGINALVIQTLNVLN